MTSASLNWPAALADAPGGVAPGSLGMPAASLPREQPIRAMVRAKTAAIRVVRIRVRFIETCVSTG
jgi:hypothetical protein